MGFAHEWDETHFGRDDGIRCSFCGETTYLIDDQGGGYCGYQCNDCGETFAVQYDVEKEEDHSDFYERNCDD